MTKGGRFLPGHDARYHAAQKAGRADTAFKHALGGHGTAGKAGPDEAQYQRAMADEKPGDEAPVGEGVKTGEKGTRVAPGMWVRATRQMTQKGQSSVEGIVFNVDPHGNIAFLDEDGRQHIGYTGMTWVVDTNVKRKPNPAQRRALANMGREVPGLGGTR
jgi:hypothetical protein